MSNAFTRILARAIQSLESGAGVDAVLSRHPEQAGAVQQHIALWRALNAAPLAGTDPAQMTLGRQLLLGTLAAGEGPRMVPALMSSTFARAAAVFAGALLLAGSAAGASAGLGGPDVTGDALNVVGVAQDDDDAFDDDCLAASPAPSPAAGTPTPAAEDDCPDDDADDVDDANECDDDPGEPQVPGCVPEPSPDDDAVDDDCLPGAPSPSPEATPDDDGDDCLEEQEVEDDECDDDSSGPSNVPSPGACLEDTGDDDNGPDDNGDDLNEADDDSAEPTDGPEQDDDGPEPEESPEPNETDSPDDDGESDQGSTDD
jgi:hypothetical protein